MESFIKIMDNHIELFLFIIIIMEALVIIILVAFFVNKIKTERNKNRNLSYQNDNNNRQINSWQKEYYLLRNEYIKIYRELNALKNERERWQKKQEAHSNSEHVKRNIYLNNESENGLDEYLKNENNKLNRVQETKNDDGTVKSVIDFDLTNNESTPVLTPHKYEYLETANGGQFRKLLLSDEKSFFRTWEESGTRKFEFYGNVDKALANINAVFDDVCEIEGKQNGATQIINVEPGILSGQLKVEKKAIIKLI